MGGLPAAQGPFPDRRATPAARTGEVERWHAVPVRGRDAHVVGVPLEGVVVFGGPVAGSLDVFVWRDRGVASGCGPRSTQSYRFARESDLKSDAVGRRRRQAIAVAAGKGEASKR